MARDSQPAGSSSARLSPLGALWLTSVAMVLGLLALGVAGALWALFTGVQVSQGFERATRQITITTCAQALAMGTAIVVGLRHASEPRQRLASLALRPVAPAALCLFFVAGLALQLPLAELANQLYAHVFEPMSAAEQQALTDMLSPASILGRLVVLLCLSVIVPVCEELLFRGVILRGLIPSQGRAGALLLSAALFGLCHMRPVPMLYAFAAGLGLGGVALVTRSVFAGIAMHAGVNALPVLLQAQRMSVPGLNVPSEGVSHLPVGYSLGGLCAAGLLTAAATWLHCRRRD